MKLFVAVVCLLFLITINSADLSKLSFIMMEGTFMWIMTIMKITDYSDASDDQNKLEQVKKSHQTS